MAVRPRRIFLMRFMVPLPAPGSTAEGLVGQAARMIAYYLPPPPAGAPSPWSWAAEDSVKALLGPFGYSVRLTRRMATLSYRSPESYLSYLEEVHGPTIMALRLAAEQGRRAELSAGLFELYSGANSATDGTLAFDQEYLLATAAAPANGSAEGSSRTAE